MLGRVIAAAATPVTGLRSSHRTPNRHATVQHIGGNACGWRGLAIGVYHCRRRTALDLRRAASVMRPGEGQRCRTSSTGRRARLLRELVDLAREGGWAEHCCTRGRRPSAGRTGRRPSRTTPISTATTATAASRPRKRNEASPARTKYTSPDEVATTPVQHVAADVNREHDRHEVRIPARTLEHRLHEVRPRGLVRVDRREPRVQQRVESRGRHVVDHRQHGDEHAEMIASRVTRL